MVEGKDRTRNKNSENQFPDIRSHEKTKNMKILKSF